MDTELENTETTATPPQTIAAETCRLQRMDGLLELSVARAENRCRMCGHKITRVTMQNPLVLEYGEEYAHRQCLQQPIILLTRAGAVRFAAYGVAGCASEKH